MYAEALTLRLYPDRKFSKLRFCAFFYFSAEKALLYDFELISPQTTSAFEAVVSNEGELSAEPLFLRPIKQKCDDPPIGRTRNLIKGSIFREEQISFAKFVPHESAAKAEKTVLPSVSAMVNLPKCLAVAIDGSQPAFAGFVEGIDADRVLAQSR